MLTDAQMALIQSAYYAGAYGGKNVVTGVVTLTEELGKVLKAMPDDQALATAQAWKQSLIDNSTNKVTVMQDNVSKKQAEIAADQAILDGTR